MSILDLFCITEVVEDSRFSCQSKTFQANAIVNTEAQGDLTWVLSRGIISFSQAHKGTLTVELDP